MYSDLFSMNLRENLADVRVHDRYRNRFHYRIHDRHHHHDKEMMAIESIEFEFEAKNFKKSMNDENIFFFMKKIYL